MTSRTTYTATAGQTSFGIPFRYLLESFVKVTINGTVTTDFTITGSTVSDGVYDGGNVVLNSGATAGDTVAVYRDSGIDDTNRLVDFEAGARLLETDLDKSALQLLHLIQEVKDNSATSEDMTITIADVVGLQTALDGKAANSVFTTSTNGIVPGPTSSQAAGDYFLRADGTWVAVSTSGGGGSGASVFTALADVPNSYGGQQFKFVAVNSNEDGLEFTDAITSLGSLSDVNFGSSTPNDGDAIVYDGASSNWLLSPTASLSLTGANAYQEGNLLVGDGNGNYTPLGNGTNGQVLKVNTAVAGNLQWAAESGGGVGGDLLVRQTGQGDLTISDGQAIPFAIKPAERGSNFTMVSTNTYLDLSGQGGGVHTSDLTNAGIRVLSTGFYKVDWRCVVRNTGSVDLTVLGRAYERPGTAASNSVAVAKQFSTGMAFVPSGKVSMVSGTFYIECDTNDTLMLTLVGQNAGNLAFEFDNMEILGQGGFFQIQKV